MFQHPYIAQLLAEHHAADLRRAADTAGLVQSAVRARKEAQEDAARRSGDPGGAVLDDLWSYERLEPSRWRRQRRPRSRPSVTASSGP